MSKNDALAALLALMKSYVSGLERARDKGDWTHIAVEAEVLADRERQAGEGGFADRAERLLRAIRWAEAEELARQAREEEEAVSESDLRDMATRVREQAIDATILGECLSALAQDLEISINHEMRPALERDMKRLQFHITHNPPLSRDELEILLAQAIDMQKARNAASSG